MHWNENLFWLIYNLAHKHSWLDYLGIFCAHYLPYLLGAVFFVLLFFPTNKRKENRRMLVFSAGSALIARLVLKPLILLFYHEPRPFVALTQVRPLIATSVSENFQSFPSGHALFFFAFAAAVWLFDKRWGGLALAAAVLIGVFRIYVGVHWPIDILAGALLGVLTAWLAHHIIGRTSYKRLWFDHLPK